MYYREEADIAGKSRRLGARAHLEDQLGKKAGSLPYGVQRHLEIARDLATEPRLLLLDEPMAGMGPQENMKLMRFIGNIRDEFDLTILLIEHDGGYGNMTVHLGHGIRCADRRRRPGDHPLQPGSDPRLSGQQRGHRLLTRSPIPQQGARKTHAQNTESGCTLWRHSCRIGRESASSPSSAPTARAKAASSDPLSG